MHKFVLALIGLGCLQTPDINAINPESKRKIKNALRFIACMSLGVDATISSTDNNNQVYSTSFNDNEKNQHNNNSQYENRVRQVGNMSIYYPGDIDITFDDVAGLDDAKSDMGDVISYLQDPTVYHNMGAKPPKGILMSGGPGNGKTLLARAVAGEVNCPFISISGSSFVEMYVGVGASRVRELFAEAKKLAEEFGGCIIFIDEIDALISTRSNSDSGGDGERNQTINAFLAEVDGLDKKSAAIIILGATNRVDKLDSAAIRPGRFDRKVEVTKPTYKGRIYLLENSLKSMNASPDLDMTFVARLTIGFSGADLANLINEAAVFAVTDRATCITMKHVEQAYDYIKLGRQVKGLGQTKDDKWKLAITQAAITVGYSYKDKSSIVYKTSITPHVKALAMTHVYSLNELSILTEKDLRNLIAIELSGDLALKTFNLFDDNNQVSASLQEAQRYAYDVIVRYTMPNQLDDIAYDDINRKLSQKDVKTIHNAIRKIIEECQVQAQSFVSERKKEINKIAKLLIEKETIYGDEIRQVLGL